MKGIAMLTLALAAGGAQAQPAPRVAQAQPAAQTETTQASERQLREQYEAWFNDPSEQAQLRRIYVRALRKAVLGHWVRPDTVPVGVRCAVQVIQLPGGAVHSARAEPDCPYDEAGKRSAEAAVLKASPLPYAGFEPVFTREILMSFAAGDE